MIRNQAQAIQNPDSVCFNCLKENEVNKIHIHPLGYGSGFDGWSTRIQLCDNCLELTDGKWWELVVMRESGYIEYYEYEEEIFDFVRKMPIEGQELFWNKYSNDYQIDSQDWIDYKLDILPHDKCKEYGMYSPLEKEAYRNRFPVCDKVKLVVYSDNSKGCRCPLGVFGNEDGTTKGCQTYSQCYECKIFEERKNEKIKAMTEEDFDVYRLENKLALKRTIKLFKTKKS